MKGRKGLGMLVMAFAVMMTLAFGVKLQANAFYDKNKEFYNTNSLGNGDMAKVVQYRVSKVATGKGTESSGAGEVVVVGCKDGAKSIVIQAGITAPDGAYYRTVSIDRAAFKDNDDLKFVQINNNTKITAIPESCFAGCTSLKTVQIQDPDIKIFKESAFKNCKNLKTFKTACNKTTKLSYVKSNAFKNVKNVKFYCPKKSSAKKLATLAKKRGAKKTSYDELD